MGAVFAELEVESNCCTGLYHSRMIEITLMLVVIAGHCPEIGTPNLKNVNRSAVPEVISVFM
jgi:hypothetical protein